MPKQVNSRRQPHTQEVRGNGSGSNRNIHYSSRISLLGFKDPGQLLRGFSRKHLAPNPQTIFQRQVHTGLRYLAAHHLRPVVQMPMDD